MKCPKCKSIQVLTVSSKASKDGFFEKLECLRCHHNWEETSYKP